MTSASGGSLLQVLQQVPDPRGRKGRRHSLVAMLATVVCATLCGVRGYRGIGQWLHALPIEAAWALGFTRRPPKHDAFRLLMMALDPVAFEQAITTWATGHLGLSPGELRAFALDGKSVRGSAHGQNDALHLLAVVDHRTGGVLHQRAVPETTNEHKTALMMIRSLLADGMILTADAAFTQRDLCAQITSSGGHYVLPAKDNQPSLKEAIETELTADEAAFSPRPSSAA